MADAKYLCRIRIWKDHGPQSTMVFDGQFQVEHERAARAEAERITRNHKEPSTRMTGYWWLPDHPNQNRNNGWVKD